ncbi:MAG: hypothetical protein HY927_06835 [Elusimicrobia bacterium]|nr:hypothetical protein [Elusimicrobiota bacterium]
MRIARSSSFLAVLAWAGLAYGGEAPAYSPAGGGFSFELSPGWREGPPLGAGTYVLLSTGSSAARYRPSITVRRHDDADPRAWRRFARRKARAGGGKAPVQEVVVAGVAGLRFQVSSGRVVPREVNVRTSTVSIHQSLPPERVALREDTVVLPAAKGFVVLVYSAAAAEASRGQPAFDLALETLRLAARRPAGPP